MEDLRDRIFLSMNHHRSVPRTLVIHHYGVNPNPDREVSTQGNQKTQEGQAGARNGRSPMPGAQGMYRPALQTPQDNLTKAIQQVL